MELGCGSYEAYVLTRGGGGFVDRVPFGALEWGRVLDDTSDASAANILGADCCDLLGVVRPWQHELSIHRDGAQQWVGPIVRVEPSGSEHFTLHARDVSAWWDRRLVHVDHVYEEEELAVIFQAVADDAMAPDNSPGIAFASSPTGVAGTLTVLAAQHRTVGPLLRELADTGIDWTVVRRDVVAGGLAVPTRRLASLADHDFASPPAPTIDGTAMVTRSVVTGAGTGAEGDAAVGDAADEVAVAAVGLLEEAVALSDFRDAASVQAAAASNIALAAQLAAAPPLQNVLLAASAPVGVDDLVPGAVVLVRLTEGCFPINALYRLQSVAVGVDGDDEQVRISLQPLGTRA